MVNIRHILFPALLTETSSVEGGSGRSTSEWMRDDLFERDFLHNLRFWSPEVENSRHSWNFSAGSGFPSSRTDQKGFGCRLKGGNETSWPLMFQKHFLKEKRPMTCLLGRNNLIVLRGQKNTPPHVFCSFGAPARVGISLQVNRLVTELFYHLKSVCIKVWVIWIRSVVYA